MFSFKRENEKALGNDLTLNCKKIENVGNIFGWSVTIVV